MRDVALKRLTCTKTAELTDVDDLHNKAVFDRFRNDVVLNRAYMFDCPPLLYSMVLTGNEVPDYFQHAYHVKTRPQNYDDGRGDAGGDQCEDMQMKTFSFYAIDGEELVRVTNAFVLAFYVPGEGNEEWLSFF